MGHIVGDSIEKSAAIQDPRSVTSSEYQELVNAVNVTLASSFTTIYTRQYPHTIYYLRPRRVSSSTLERASLAVLTSLALLGRLLS
jgi:hypothetical protein